MSDSTDLAVREGDKLLTLALEKGLDTQTLKDLIDLRNSEISRQAKVDFDLNFAAMQMEFLPIAKTKYAKDGGGNQLYAFAPLEDILAVAAPVIASHGFSFKWSEETIGPKEKRIWCIVSGYGHQEKSYVDIPVIEGTRATNAIQARGISTSYGKRYSFINAFGIQVGGEDDDTHSIKAEAIRDDEPASPAQDPKAEAEAVIRDEVKAQIAIFVAIMGAEDGGEPYFSDEEKADAKKKIAETPKELKLKLEVVRQIVRDYEGKLKERRGNTPLAQAVQDALRSKNEAQQEELI